jgi:Domain of unknown function (DUF4388)
MSPNPKPLDKQSKAALRDLSRLCDKAEKLCVPIQRVLVETAVLPPHREIVQRVDQFQTRLAVVNAALHQLEERSFKRGGGAAERHASQAMRRMQSSRVGASGTKARAKASSGGATLAGKCPEFPLTSVLQFVVAQKKTGTLKIKLPDESLSFQVVDGNIVHSSTDRPRRGERLGEILIENGHVTMHHFMAFVDSFRSEDRLLGMAMVEKGLVTQDALTSALEEQMQTHFDRAFDAEECSFEFFVSPLSGQTGLHISVSEFLVDTGRVRGSLQMKLPPEFGSFGMFGAGDGKLSTQPDDTQPDDTQPDDTQPDDTQPDDTQPDDTRDELEQKLSRDADESDESSDAPDNSGDRLIKTTDDWSGGPSVSRWRSKPETE